MRKLKLPGRSKDMPKLNEADVKLIQDLGIQEMKKQARQIVEEKLEKNREKDTSQTPYAGNPVYKAMHACRASSRRELSHAHRIPREKKLSERDIKSVVNLLTRWIAREYNFYQDEAPTSQKKIKEF